VEITFLIGAARYMVSGEDAHRLEGVIRDECADLHGQPHDENARACLQLADVLRKDNAGARRSRSSSAGAMSRDSANTSSSIAKSPAWRRSRISATPSNATELRRFPAVGLDLAVLTPGSAQTLSQALDVYYERRPGEPYPRIKS
jgi:hypothetical protein